MLGGSVFIALIRFTISLAGTALLYNLLSRPRFSREKTIVCYGCFGLVVIGAACIWYVVDWESCVRMAALVIYLCFAVFAIYMSNDPIYLSFYKIALTFYFMAIFLIGGIEVAVIFFGRNIWADIFTRICLILLLAYFVKKKVRDAMFEFHDCVENEMDRFSITILIMSILFGIGFILNPNVKEQTPYRLFQIAMNFFLTGALQILVFRLYLHIGREKKYQKENQLIKMNHRLLEYLMEYEKEADTGMEEEICANTAVNHLLSAYTRRARQKEIQVTLDVELDKDLTIPNIDLVTILANAFENAIYNCVEVRKQSADQKCFIHLLLKKKKNKLIICLRNTCRMETELCNGQPKPEFTGGIGVLSIIKTAEKFDGEYDFKNDGGVFVFRLIMNL